MKDVPSMSLLSEKDRQGEEPPVISMNLRRRLIRVRKNILVVIGTVIIFLLVLMGIFAPALAPADPVKPNLVARNMPPGSQGEDGLVHIIGTDHLGRDLFSRLLFGLRISLAMGTATMLMAGIFGTFMGLISGYFGGRIDDIMMRIVDIQMSFPYILLAIVLAVFWGTGLWQIIFIVAIRGWVDYARVVRGSVLTVKNEVYVEAARALGASDLRIIFRHVLPNIFSPVVIISTFQVGRAIVLESTLSFLGLGLSPPTPSLGGILTDGRGYLVNGWWAVAGSGTLLILLVMGINLFGDGLRDILDPQLNRT